MGNIHTVSSLGKTWILDLDGTIVKHNGYKLDGKDSLLAGAETLINQISKEDMVIIITSRKEMYRDMTEEFLHEHQIPYDYIVFEAPYGERILVNDRKPSGLDMAIAVNTERNEVMEDKFFIDGKL
jgi:hypothetical protein